jgi:sorbitol-6-phosphate 2-dehydrogenase
MRGLGLEGKSVVVTGSASGIGAAVVDRLLEEGASVAAFDLAPTPPREGAKKRFVARAGDVTSQEDVDALLDLAHSSRASARSTPS